MSTMIKLIEDKLFTIYVMNDDPNYMFFEHNDLGEEMAGGLWFNADKELIDYDGVFMLPFPLIKLLQDHGYNMDYCLDDDEAEN